MNRLKTSLIIALAIIQTSCDPEGVPDKGRTLHVRTENGDLPIYLFGNDQSDDIILVLHGGPGGNGMEYRSGVYAEMLEEKYIMAYLDQRGQGMSRSSRSEQMSIDLLVRDIAAVVDVLNIEFFKKRIFILCHSWGGTLGTAYMLDGRNKNSIQGWIESDGAHDIPLLNKEAIKMFIDISEQEIGAGRNTAKWTEIRDWALELDTNNITDEQSGQINSYGHEAEGLLEQIPDSSAGGVPYRLLRSPVDPIVSSISGNKTSSLLIESGIEELSYTSRLNEITTPTLLLWGKYDFVVPPALAHSAYDELGSTKKKKIIYEFSGHSPMNSQPVKFAQDIIEFVDGL